MAEAGLQEVDTYVTRPQNTVSQYISTRTIMYMCLAADRHLGTRVLIMWWDQDLLDLEGMVMADC